MSKTLSAAVPILLLTTMRVSAHHAFAAEYDENKRVTVSGTVGLNGALYVDQVTVEGFAAKDGKNTANAATVTLPDGRKLFGGFHSTPGAPVR